MLTPKLSQVPGTTHEAILLHLKKNGDMTISELCKVLEITPMAVRRHLISLKKDDLVEFETIRQKRGRPVDHYRLGKKAVDIFPSGYQSIASDFLDMIYEEQGHKGVMEFLERRNKRVVDKLKTRLINKNLAERVAEVAKIFSEDGYMTEWEALPDGDFILYQHNCALHNLANRYRQICVLEPKLIEELLQTKVIRKQYMLKNDPVCGYLVQH